MTARPLLYDLYSGAGGASMGYHRSGFEVVGIDIKAQPRYPFRFIQMDALEFVQRTMDGEYEMPAAWAASPPCQAYSVTKTIWQREHPDLVGPTRDAMEATGLPYVIENVVGAPLRTTIQLCGSMFGLRVYRHRLFESNVMLWQPFHPRHEATCTQVGRQPKTGEFMTVAGHFADVKTAGEYMGIDWMTRDQLSQAIPPAYTEFIGHQLMSYLERRKAA